MLPARLLAGFAGFAFLAGCACAPKGTAPELFAVLPNAQGKAGSIAVQRGGQTHVIDSAYGARRFDAKGTVSPGTLSAAEVRAGFGETLEALPGRPTSFTLYFLEGSDELTPESRTELDKVFLELRRRPLPDIVVIGHTDSVGGLAYNDRLSLQRAERLRDMLAGLGISAERIQAAGRGKRELLVPTEDNIAEARNRRVEINVR